MSGQLVTPVTVATTQPEQPKTTVTVLPEIPTSWEKYTVLLLFGFLMLYMGYAGNKEAMIFAGTTIATYFMSRAGV